MNKKIAVLLTTVFALSGCASILDPNGASGDYSCIDPDNPDRVVDGVTCKTPFAIYQSTHEPAPLKASDLPVGVTLQDYEADQKASGQSPYAGPSLTDSTYSGQSYQLPGQMVPQDQAQYARPVRVPPTVMRIWLAPWIDANDDLHFPSHIYSEIQPRRWAFGEKENANRGMTVPTRQLSTVPASEVKPNERQPLGETDQLQPYQPLGTGSQMPTLP